MLSKASTQALQKSTKTQTQPRDTNKKHHLFSHLVARALGCLDGCYHLSGLQRLRATKGAFASLKTPQR